MSGSPFWELIANLPLEVRKKLREIPKKTLKYTVKHG